MIFSGSRLKVDHGESCFTIVTIETSQLKNDSNGVNGLQWSLLVIRNLRGYLTNAMIMDVSGYRWEFGYVWQPILIVLQAAL